MGRIMARNLAASARQRLLNLSKTSGTDYNQLLIRYGIERLLYRLGGSGHADEFILDRQDLELAAVPTHVMHEVVRPDVVRVLRSARHAETPAATAAVRIMSCLRFRGIRFSFQDLAKRRRRGRELQPFRLMWSRHSNEPEESGC